MNSDPNTKLNPPLRTKRDGEVIQKALRNGTIDCIASDHPLLPLVEKEKELDVASYGIIGLETTLPLSHTYLYHRGILSLSGIVEKLSLNPSSVLNLTAGRVSPVLPAETTIIDLHEKRVITTDFHSKSMTFIKWRLKGFSDNVLFDFSIRLKKGEICS